MCAISYINTPAQNRYALFHFSQRFRGETEAGVVSKRGGGLVETAIVEQQAPVTVTGG